MGYYRGSRVLLGRKEGAAPSLEGGRGWRDRMGRAAEGTGSILRWFGPKRKKAQEPEGAVRTFYRPGVTAAQDTPALEAKGGGRFRLPSLGGMKWALRGLGLLLLLGAVVWSKQRTTVLLQDAAGLRLAKVIVEGNHYLTEGEVVRAAGLALGENMFDLDLKSAAERIRRLDWVERVFIERRLPSSLLISIKERKVEAILDNGALYGVDREGRLLSPSSGLLGRDLPLISGVAVPPEAEGTTVLAEGLRPALDFLDFMRKHDGVLAGDLSEVNLSEKDALRATFLDGIQATFTPPVTETELRRMALVLGDLNGKQKRAGTMDFRFKDMVLVRTR